MRKALFVVLSVLLLAACSFNPSDDETTTPGTVTPEQTQPAEPASNEPVVESPHYYVYNSNWERQTAVEESYTLAARTITESTIEEYKAKYNKGHTGDQVFVYTNEVSIEEAPEATGYICNPMTLLPIKVYENIPRKMLKESRDIWAIQAYADGGVLYVDHLPEPYVETRTEREIYSVYIIAPDKSIFAVDYCSEDDWKTAGYTSLQAYYDGICAMYNVQTLAMGEGYRMQTGHYYTPPDVTE